MTSPHRLSCSRRLVPIIRAIRLSALLLLFATAAIRPLPSLADEPAIAELPVARASGEAMTVSELTARVNQSVVVVTIQGRDGQDQGLGSGFVISPDGLIVTNMHVIGEARPIAVSTADGKKYPVVSIHATEPAMDLAVIRVDAKNLVPLELGDSDALRQGESVVAIGNPIRYRHSVVTGVVSGKREIDNRPMIQLAMPIEPGNSGGPLLDMQGRVHGVITLKSRVTDNLGFAVAINALRPLLKSPNPVPMARWLTIGTLDPHDWKTLFGSTWRQRAGRIVVEGQGDGIGRRGIAVLQAKPPESPYEIAVAVRLDNESGAAGLIFRSDGNEKHYGFYPSGGKLRFSRFDGPDVFNWQVLKEVAAPSYRPGDWNILKVRIDGTRYRCFVNDVLVIDETDGQYIDGNAGLAQFRGTKSEFRNFRVAKSIPRSQPSDDERARITKLVEDIAAKRPPRIDLVDKLAPEGELGSVVLRERAKLLEKQAERLRQLARATHQQDCRRQLRKIMEQKEEEIDLLHAALLIARIDNDELDVDAYRATVERIAAEVRKGLDEKADDKAKLAALGKHLYEQLGFHASRMDYYSRSNSFMNEVIDDREGIPITLSVLYIELARRLGVNVVGVGLPGHFLVRHEPKEGPATLIDAYEKGRELTKAQAVEMVTSSGREFDDEYLATQSKQQILIRMLRNLMGIARNGNDPELMLQYVETVLALDPHSAEDRWFRSVLYYQTDRTEEALADVDWLLEREPPGLDLNRVRQLRKILEEKPGP